MSEPPSFHAFAQLPAEIRLDIWRYSCYQPRVVEVYYDSERDLCTTTTPQPPTLSVCSESRSEALRVYKALFGTITHTASIYFNTELDTLYLPRPTYMGYDDNSRDFAQLATGALDVVNLALDRVNPAIRRPWETYNKYTLMQSFPRVAEVYLILDSNHDHHDTHHNAKHGFLRLAEPAREISEISKLLQDVKMSFSYEAGVDFETGDMKAGLPKPPALVLKSKVETNYPRLL
jgi:hypothetical protein